MFSTRPHIGTLKPHINEDINIMFTWQSTDK